MLKAVSLDEKKYGFLLKFIDEYRDENGKENASAAIRFLMQKGYESLNGNIEEIHYEPKQKQINYKQIRDKIKSELKAEVLNEVNQQVMSSLSSVIETMSKKDDMTSIVEKLLHSQEEMLQNQLKGQEKILNNQLKSQELIKQQIENLNVQPIQQNVNQAEKHIEPAKEPVKRRSKKNIQIASDNELLANILNNVNR